MPISEERLASIIGRAANLCRPEMDNAKAKGRVNEGNMANGGPLVSEYDADADKWDRMFSASVDDEYTPRTANDIQYGNNAFENSAMPSQIKKSMMENKIDVSALNPNATPVLDKLGIKGKPLSAPAQQRKQVNEQVMQPATYQPAAGIDYSIIKAIVSECIREYFSNNAINENAISQITLKKGTIGITDSSGNEFRAKLEKVN